MADTDESTVRLAVINMVEKCPSGAITYRFDDDDTDGEPEYAAQIAVIDDGPLWVTGAIPVTTSDGTELEARPRVTLCRCGPLREQAAVRRVSQAGRLSRPRVGRRSMVPR